MKTKIISFFFIFILLFVFHIKPSYAQMPADVMFINQVRGNECCDKGSVENLKLQINTFIENSLPAYFAVRYDALSNRTYADYLKSVVLTYPVLIRLGVLLEITPSLAHDAGVVYRGKTDQWYEAQNIFTVGYSHEDSKKIVDAVFGKFNDEFGFYPEIVSSWMIDTETVNYINSIYKIKLFQITREQWGQDSYTLYGGPPHFPYPASQNWAFISDYSRTEGPIIIRQTVTDPLKNYGDMTSSFTSQPNDYIRDKKQFNYFTDIVNQAIRQKPKGFANLGLENSMDIEFQKEYVKQIKYIKKLLDAGAVQIQEKDRFIDYWQKQKFTVYGGTDLVGHSRNNAYWIATPNYRVRLRELGKKIMIDDYRVFDTNFDDPYKKAVAKKQGFWIVPYLIDGSHNFQTDKNHDPSLVQNDENIHINSIELSDKNSDQEQLRVETSSDKIVISYLGKKRKNVIISFKSDTITLSPSNKNEIVYKNYNSLVYPIKYQKINEEFLLKWELNNKIILSLKSGCKNDSCQLKQDVLIPNLHQARTEQYPFLFPEPVDREINLSKTAVYTHNKYAVSGRNPARIVVIPYDKYGMPLKINYPVEVITSPQSSVITSTDGLIQYIDVASAYAAKVDVQIKIGKKELKKESVYLTINCSKQLFECISNPKYLWWYINSFIGDKYRQIILREKQ